MSHLRFSGMVLIRGLSWTGDAAGSPEQLLLGKGTGILRDFFQKGKELIPGLHELIKERAPLEEGNDVAV